MKIYEKTLEEIMPYERNPRNNEDAVEQVANSIQEFGFKVPIVIDAAGVIVTGHTRYKAAKKLGLETVPCIIADDLSPYQIQAFRIADNKVSEYSTWDFDLLEEELKALEDEYDLEDLGFNENDFNFDEIEDEEKEEIYSTKVNVPQYEITGDKPSLEECLNIDKADELIEEINKSNVTDEEKEFLIQAARRHNIFNYRNIAEYYAHANAEMQDLMEKSALVIIDFDDAIANGYTNLKRRIEELRLEQEEFE